MLTALDPGRLGNSHIDAHGSFTRSFVDPHHYHSEIRGGDSLLSFLGRGTFRGDVTTILAGQVVSASASVQPWVRFDVILGDGTGTIILRFLGRTVVPGMSSGRQVRVEGTPSLIGDALVMLNPIYEFIASECVSN